MILCLNGARRIVWWLCCSPHTTKCSGASKGQQYTCRTTITKNLNEFVMISQSPSFLVNRDNWLQLKFVCFEWCAVATQLDENNRKSWFKNRGILIHTAFETITCLPRIAKYPHQNSALFYVQDRIFPFVGN